MMRRLLLISIISLLTAQVFAQGATCETATGICNPNLSYPAGVNTGSAQAGINYGCLGSQPNPAWYVLTIGSTGNGSLNITETNSNSEDVDFALWGPFTGSTGFSPYFCSQLASSGQAPIDCSFSTSATEQIDITGAVAGQTYLLLVTNYSNNNTQISLNQNGGTAALGAPITINPAGPYTTASGPVTLTSNPAAGSPNVSNVTWSGPGITNGSAGTFNPSSLAPGNYTISLAATIYGCVTSTSQVITVTAAPCNISDAALVSLTPCDPATNTYSATVSITYSGAPSSGNLVVNGQNFPIQTSGSNGNVTQQVTLTNLISNGAAVTINASFPGSGTSCTYTEANVFNAPAACTCNIAGITVGTQTPCDPATNTYTQAITVAYSNPPASGSLVVNGQNFPITTSPQTVTWTNLPANGAPVNASVSFSANNACAFTQNNAFTAPVSCLCNIISLAAGTQTACDPATGTYTQQVIVTYSNAPAAGTLNVNGQSFPITGSPQTVTLTNLPANGLAVNASASFSASAACTLSQNSLFTAPAPCGCLISNLAAGTQTACDPATNTYTQQVIVTYSNAPSSGNLVVNGQSFPITSSPQTVTLTALPSNGAAVNVTAAFSANNGCTLTTNSLFVAPLPCNCGINSVAVGVQSPCNPATNTYSQQLTFTYSNSPSTGTLMVYGQNFPITGSPQTITLVNLSANGNPVSIIANFSDLPSCTFSQPNTFTAPAACGVACNINDILPDVLLCDDNNTQDATDDTYNALVTVYFSNPPSTGNLTLSGGITASVPVSSINLSAGFYTFSVQNIPANNTAVNVTAAFDATPACTYTELLPAERNCSCFVYVCEGTTDVVMGPVPHNTDYTSYSQTYVLTQNIGGQDIIIQMGTGPGGVAAPNQNYYFSTVGLANVSSAVEPYGNIYRVWGINQSINNPNNPVPAIGTDIQIYNNPVNGCSSASSAGCRLVVNPQPTVPQPTDYVFCENDAVNLTFTQTASTTTIGTRDFDWLANGTSVGNQSTFGSFANQAGFSFAANGGNVGGSGNTNSFTVTPNFQANGPSTFPTNPTTPSACSGNSVVFNVSVPSRIRVVNATASCTFNTLLLNVTGGLPDLAGPNADPNAQYNFTFAPAGPTLLSGDITNGGIFEFANATPGTVYTITVNASDPDANPLYAGVAACSTTATITINSAPTVNAIANDIVCGEPDSLILQALPGAGTVLPATFLWDYPGNMGYSYNQFDTLFNATSAIEGTYNVTMTDANGCSVVASVDVFISDAVNQPIIAGNSPVCDGNAIALSIPTYTGNYVLYTWYHNGVAISGANNNTLIIDPATTTYSGDYTVRVQVDSCSALSMPYNVVINPLPTATPTSNATTCAVAPFNLVLTSAASGGTPAYTYAWSGPNGFASTSPNPVLYGLSQGGAGTFILTVTDANGCVADPISLAVDLRFAPVQPVISGPVTICENSDLTLTIPAYSGNSVSYAWFFNGSPLVANNSNVLVIPNILTTASGNYTVQVTVDSCSSAVSVPFAVNVTPKPVISAIAGDGIFCEGANVTLTPTTTPATGITYHWTGPNGFISNSATLSFPAATAAINGSYNLVIETANGNCASESLAANITIVQQPLTPTINATANICAGQALALLTQPYSGANISYVWSYNGGAIDTTTVSATTLASANTGFYAVQIQYGSCFSNLSAPVYVTVGAAPAVVASVSSPVCEGGATQFDATFGANFSYQWSGPAGFTSSVRNPYLPVTDAVNAGTYILVATENTTGCTAQSTIVLAVQARPATPFMPTSIAVCQGQDVTLALTANTTAGATYTWYNATTLSAIGTSTAADGAFVIPAPAIGTYEYYVVATSAVGCNSLQSATITVTVNAIGNEVAFAGDDQFVCGETLTSLAALATSGGGVWTSNSTAIIAQPSSPNTQVLNLPAGTTTFYWTLSNGACASVSVDSVTVTQETAAICANDTFNVPYRGSLDSMQVLINDTLPTTPWTINILQAPYGGNVIYMGNGMYDYTPTINFNGQDQFVYEICATSCPDLCDTAVVVLNVGDEGPCHVPNVMTPNGDGVNDAFLVRCLDGNAFPGNEINIFNRWGSKVYSAAPYMNDWQGEFASGTLPEGTYFYVLKLNDTDNTVFTGYIVIHR